MTAAQSVSRGDPQPSAAGRAVQAAWRERLRGFIEAPRVQGTLIALILVNAAILGLETSAAVTAVWGDLLYTLDRLILGLFVVEIGIRLVVYRAAFFRDAWSVFDFIVIGIALLPATGSLSVLRALRVLRVMRLISMVPSMRRVASGLLAAIPGLGSVIGIILVILYVFSVMATKIFGGAFPQWFGTLGESSYTLFQVMTLESWSMGVVRPIMEVYPYAWVFFVLFILISTFTMLNLFIAVVVNAMHAEHQREVEQAKAEANAKRDLLQEVGALRSELRLVRAMLERQNAGRETEQGR